jgi:hypothetical protein
MQMNRVNVYRIGNVHARRVVVALSFCLVFPFFIGIVLVESFILGCVYGLNNLLGKRLGDMIDISSDAYKACKRK